VAELMDVSKYKKVVKGDTIVTSDYNAVYPPNIPIGIVAKVGLQDDGTFHDIKVMLLTHFSTLRYVYVIENKFAGQQAKLDQAKPKID
jgi:rod shape-determining protein MreC